MFIFDFVVIIIFIHLIIIESNGYDCFIRYPIKSIRDENQAYLLETKIYPIIYLMLLILYCVMGRERILDIDVINYRNLIVEDVLNLLFVLLFTFFYNSEKCCIYIKHSRLIQMKKAVIVFEMTGIMLAILHIDNDLIFITTIIISQIGFISACIYSYILSQNVRIRDYREGIWLTFSNRIDKYNIPKRNIQGICIEKNICIINYIRQGESYISMITFDEEIELKKIIPVLEKYLIRYTNVE